MGSALADIFAFCRFYLPFTVPYPHVVLLFCCETAAGERALPILSAAAISFFVFLCG